MTGIKRMDHWTSGTVFECSESAGSPQYSPQQLTMMVLKLEGGPAASVTPGQKSCVRSSGIITLSVRRPSDGSGCSRGHNDQSHQGHQWRETTLTGKSWVYISTPPGDWTRVPHDRNQTGGPLDQWNCVWMQWDCRLSTTYCRKFKKICKTFLQESVFILKKIK
jgi:hypothetical protein